MTTQWARRQAQSNELLDAVQGVADWAERNRAAAVGGAILLVLLAGVAPMLFSKSRRASEASWTEFAMAQAYARAGRPADAVALNTRIGQEHPGSLAAGYGELLTADILFDQGRFKDAAEVYRRLAESQADKSLSTLALAGLGHSLEAAGDYKAAAETDQRFLDGHPDHPLASATHASLARSLERMGQADKAHAALERMSFLYPESYWAAWAKARLKK
ncbi:MAG TPA: tetratricopeptide repeat protein [Elusimicrobiota bacterium]|jgi:TolA-binding protein|nr:tetratricopeptide repeat protein [Elusimicrobiota bacterium]